MAWNSFARTDYDADKAARTGRVTSLYDRQLFALEMPHSWVQAEVTTTATGFTTIATTYWYAEDYVGGFYLHVMPEVKVSAGTGTWRIYDGTTGGSEQAITGTGYADSEGSLVISAAQVGTLITVNLQAKNGSGADTFYLRNLTRGTLWAEETA